VRAALGRSHIPNYTKPKPGADETVFLLTPRFNEVRAVRESSRLPGCTQLKQGVNETSFSLTPRFNGVKAEEQTIKTINPKTVSTVSSNSHRLPNKEPPKQNFS